ncbi:MAG: GNAT family N-acetyltransferase [Candidatus Hodarchaeales archaeon]
MAQQIPHEELVDYLPFFNEIKYLRNVLVFVSVRGSADGYVDDLEKPTVILIGNYLVGDFESPKVKDILDKILEKHCIRVDKQDWVPVLRRHWKYFGYYYRTELSTNNLSLEHVRQLIKDRPLPEGFTAKKVDLETAKHVLNQWPYGSEKITHYGGPEGFIEGAIGFCIKEGDKVVSMAAGDLAPIPITKSLEIDIMTLPEYKERGFATIVAAKIIEYCLERDIEPHWDAANEISVKLALKLGYTDPEPYKCFYWRSKPWTLSELKEVFNPGYEKGLKETNNFKSAIEASLANGQVNEARDLMSSYTKIQSSFKGMMDNINRLIKTGIVDEADEPHFNDYARKINEEIEKLVSFIKVKEEEMEKTPGNF